MHIYNRIKTVLSQKERMFYLFSNEYNKDTFDERQPSETIENYQNRRTNLIFYLTVNTPQRFMVMHQSNNNNTTIII
jgi:hypothetical protein